jgi:hypothetical protein
MPGAFLRIVPVGVTDRADSPDYSGVVVDTLPAARVGIEQFDASSRRPIVGFGVGWHEQEFNPATGMRWRWLSERGELRLHAPQTARALRLHLEGESPRRYFPRGSRLIVRAAGSTVFDRTLASDFSIDAPLPAAAGGEDQTITLETDQAYVPAERSRRTQDRRRLGLRIFTCEIRP